MKRKSGAPVKCSCERNNLTAGNRQGVEGTKMQYMVPSKLLQAAMVLEANQAYIKFLSIVIYNCVLLVSSIPLFATREQSTMMTFYLFIIFVY